MHTGAPVPEGANAVVQIENTEQLPERQDGEKRIRIVKVSPAFCHQSLLNMGFMNALICRIVLPWKLKQLDFCLHVMSTATP